MQKVELPGRQRHRLSQYQDLARVRVYPQSVEGEHPLISTSGRFFHAPQDRGDPRSQLAGAKRLHDVVVRAKRETHDSLLFLAAGREHDQGHPPVCPHPAAYLQAADLGEHKVEYDEIGFALSKDLERLFAVGGRDDVVAIAPQIEANDFPDVRLVVDDQDLRHGSFHLSFTSPRIIAWVKVAPRPPASRVPRPLSTTAHRSPGPRP